MIELDLMWRKLDISCACQEIPQPSSQMFADGYLSQSKWLLAQSPPVYHPASVIRLDHCTGAFWENGR
jgi:hypothetical protein